MHTCIPRDVLRSVLREHVELDQANGAVLAPLYHQISMSRETTGLRLTLHLVGRQVVRWIQDRLRLAAGALLPLAIHIELESAARGLDIVVESHAYACCVFQKINLYYQVHLEMLRRQGHHATL